MPKNTGCCSPCAHDRNLEFDKLARIEIGTALFATLMLWRLAACSLIMYAMVIGAVLLSPQGVPGWLSLSLLVPLGATIYFACSWAISRRLRVEMSSIL